jgi:hypothetical protein
VSGHANDRTSMRGRLALLVFGLVAGPMLIAGAVGYWHLRSVLGSPDSLTDRQTIVTGLLLRANRAAAFFHHELEDSLDDLDERTAGIDFPSAAAIAAAFDGLPAGARPSAVVEFGNDGTCTPPLPSTLVETLRPVLALQRAQAGYLLLPSGDDPAGGSLLHHVVIRPRAGGRTIVALRLAEGPAAKHLIASLPWFEEGSREISRPTEAGGLASVPACGALWRSAVEEFADNPDRAVSKVDPESGAVAGAVALADLHGRPVALCTVQIPAASPPALSYWHTALFSTVLVGLGLMAVIGLLASVVLGLLAPRCVWGQLRGTTDFIFQSVERLRELVRRNSRALDEQSDVIQRLLASVSALRNDSQAIAITARGLAHAASQSADVSQSGNEQAGMTRQRVGDLKQQIGDLSLQMEDLERRCNEIGAILSFLNHLNNETNTLSVNATIQAAGSGAASGRQLTVMAGEIGKLADLTRDSMYDIQQINERIQESSRTTLGATQEGREEVEACLTYCGELERSFARILKWVEETTQSAHGIEQSTARQSESLQSVSTAIESLERRARETVGNFQDVVMAAEELADLGQDMSRTWKVG